MTEEQEGAGNAPVTGLVYQSLQRNNAQIRKERGDAIAEDLEMTFKRGVEDLQVKLRRLSRDRDAMFDFSPTNTQSLVLVKELDAVDIQAKDMRLSIEIRNVEIELEIAKARYTNLFGKTI